MYDTLSLLYELVIQKFPYVYTEAVAYFRKPCYTDMS